MSLKTIIKNDLWRWNYILPFVLKYQADNRGIVYIINKAVTAYRTISPIKSKGKRTVGRDIKELLLKIDITIDNSNGFIYFIDVHKTVAVSGNILGNFCLDYSIIIDRAFDEIYQEAVNDEYGREARLVMEGMLSLCDRIIKEIADKDSKIHNKNKYIQYYKDMFMKPAEHFEEALQRILFFNQILWQTRHRLNGLGRLDKILNRVYNKDIESGYITKKEAEIILDDFLITLSKYPEYKSDSLMGDIGQIIILGGLTSDEDYFYNDLTLMFLEAIARVKRPDPKVLLRVSKFMPDYIINNITECLLAQTGSPLLSNDDVVIPAIESSFSKEDIYNYHTSACWEPFIAGKSFDQNNIAVYSYFDVLEDVLAAEHKSFNQLVKQYIKSNSECFARFLKTLDSIKWAKDPLVSMFTGQCNKSRCDISDGGAQYNNYGVTTVGLGNVIDSLLNIKELVFEKRLITLKELNKARLSDFKKDDKLYTIISNMNKHYGHDDKLTIELANKITEAMADVAKNYKNKFGGTVKFGLSSPSYNKRGMNANGDLSGRKAREAFNTHISCSDVTYTELVGFASKLDYTEQRYNGNVIDFFISPIMISGNKEKFNLFLKGAIFMGFFQMQMNLMDSKTLIDAKKNPNRYPGLIVRVWGFSAYFNDLPEDYQNILINRAIMAESI